jgi:Tol biopolymer transport system component
MDPSLSPDGSKILFTSDKDNLQLGFPTSAVEIYVINADGSDETRLTFDSNSDSQPSWSPGGDKIVYVTYEEVAGEWRYALYTMNSDGSGQTRLTPLEDPYRNVTGNYVLPYYANPLWSPDGTKIIFKRFTGKWELYSINPDGSGLTQLASGHVNAVGNYAFSPDGSKIVYTSDQADPGETDIWIMNSDGSNKTRLTFYGSPGVFPSQASFSPDETRIVFVWTNNNLSNPPSTIRVINVDGTNDQTRASNGTKNVNPVWSPDGSKIAFISNQSGSDELYIMDFNGANQTKLTSSSSISSSRLLAWLD